MGNYSSLSRHSKLRVLDAEPVPITDNRRDPGFSWPDLQAPRAGCSGSGQEGYSICPLGEDLRHRYCSNIEVTLGELIVEFPASLALQKMQWSRRGLKPRKDVESSVLASFDIVLHDINLAAVPVDISSSANFLVSNGAILLSIPGASVGALTLGALAEKLADIAGSSIQVSDFVDGRALVYVRVSQPSLAVPAGPFESVIIQSFRHVQEGDLIEIEEAEELSFALDPSISNLILIDDFSVAIFDLKEYPGGMECLSAFKSCIHNRSSEDPAITSGLASSHIPDISRFATCPVPSLRHGAMGPKDVDSLVITPEPNHSQSRSRRQLFNPHTSYILPSWAKSLTKLDNLYVPYPHTQGVQVEVIAADALDMEWASAVVENARKAGPIGGIFVTTQSKVAVLHFWGCIDPSAIDFMLLFSIIGPISGNAGQAACASELYLDRIGDIIPKTTCMSFPPLILASSGVSQACNLIRDWPIRKIGQYVPILATNDVIALVGRTGIAESPAILLAALLAMEVEQIVPTSQHQLRLVFPWGQLDTANQLKACLGIQVSQIEPLGSMSIGTLNEMLAKAGAQAVEGRGSSNG
ncbi:hypothetical protein BU15DRAFT_82116 [Melanogaster broomeanus]|nr:hypothetical protein BU15DRAFT_82116 [Melanogaster broomeanus]